jgi:spore maturation protein CgeB
MTEVSRLAIVGIRGGTSVGESLLRAAWRRGLDCLYLDSEQAFAAPRLVRGLMWRLCDHRPLALGSWSRYVVDACTRRRPRWLLCTGLAPLDATALEAIGRLGVTRINFLTDDPWNPRLSSRWFLDALRHYDHVFTPRRANVVDLVRHGRGSVSHLPFGYDPELCFPDLPSTAEELSRLSADVVFVGGADPERVPFIAAMIRDGFDVALYGGYWGRYRQTRRRSRGHADLATVRKATSTAKVALCLVRRANRDGHVMRSLEIAAMGACMLVEDTPEHRDLFGPPGRTVTYFASIPELLTELRRLVNDAEERRRLAAAVRKHILEGRHTYDDRLRAMLAAVEARPLDLPHAPAEVASS